MNPKRPVNLTSYRLVAVLCIVILVPGDALALAYQASTSQPQTASTGQAVKIPADQLDSLVAPIALYPDPLLAQVLAASTYPLEIVQLHQFLTKNPSLKDKALVDAVAKQPWEPAVQSMAMVPDVVKRMAEDIQWTADLGNAFLAQQSDVMEAVQRMRKKAEEKGNLKTTEHQKVETKVVENKSVIVVEQANPQVVYVPSYNPVYVYGPPIYPYPPIYYPPPGYYYAGMAISFGVGVAMGAAWGGWWGGCGWGGNDIDIDIDNSFNRNSNRNVNRNTNRTNVSNRAGAGSGNKWQHNPQHRGGAPYSDRATANKFGGTARGDSISNRQASARQQLSSSGGNLASTRSSSGLSNRSSGSGVSDRSLGSSSSSRYAGSGSSERIGSRDMSRSGGSNRSAFGSGSGNYSGGSARSSSYRGSSSFGSRGGFRGGGRRR